MKLTNKQIELYATIELITLQNQTEVDFILDKEGLDLSDDRECFYGQIFGVSYNKEARAFKKIHDIKIIKYAGVNQTCLERILCKLWNEGRRKQCYQILETFCSWKNEVETVNLNDLFEGWDK